MIASRREWIRRALTVGAALGLGVPAPPWLVPAGLAGVVLGSAARRVPVIADGFISSTAALAAVRLVPAAAGYLIASHRSVEPGHRKVLEAIGVPPLLDLDLRLGEGTGAALAMHLAEASIRVLLEMATFDSAGVSDSGS